MKKKNLYADDVHAEIRNRLDKLTPETQAEWGKMSTAQMLAHCAEVQEVNNGKELVGTPFLVRVFGGLIKRLVLSEKPYPNSTGTHPQYVIAGTRDFEEQKARLLEALDEMKKSGSTASKHPIFGQMSADEKGWATYKHLDHHLTQFGV